MVQTQQDRTVSAGGRSEHSTIHGRAATGFFALVGRSLVARLLGLSVFAWYASNLPSEEFGRISLAVTSTAVFGIASTAALGVALIRRDFEPSPEEYGHLVAAQLLLGMIIVLLVTGGVWVFTDLDPRLTLIVVAANPITALVAPLLVQCERRLNFGPIGISDAAEAIVFTLMAFAIGLVWTISIWGLALCYFVRPFVSNIVLARLVKDPPTVSMTWSVSGSRRVISAGGALSGSSLLGVLTDWAFITFLVRGVGTSAAATWSVVDRLSLIPRLALGSLQQVCLPALSRIGVARRQVADRIGSTLVLVAAVPGTLSLFAVAPILKTVLGSKYHEAAGLFELVLALLCTTGAFTVANSVIMIVAGRSRSVLFIRAAEGLIIAGATAMFAPRSGLDAVSVALVVGATVASLVTLNEFRCVYGRLPHRSTRAMAVGLVMSALSAGLSRHVSGVMGYIGSLALIAALWATMIALLHPGEFQVAMQWFGRQRLGTASARARSARPGR